MTFCSLGANEKRKALDYAQGTHISADAEAERIATVDGARAKLEAEQLTLLRDAPAPVLATVAATAFAAHVERNDGRRAKIRLAERPLHLAA